MRFYDDIVYDQEYNGLVLDDDEGQLRQILLPAVQLFSLLLSLPLAYFCSVLHFMHVLISSAYECNGCA